MDAKRRDRIVMLLALGWLALAILCGATIGKLPRVTPQEFRQPNLR